MKLSHKSSWNPYICGILIGLLQIPTYFYLKSSIGTSRAFSALSCSINSFFHGEGSNELLSVCFSTLKNWWQLGFAVGIVLGAFVARKLSGSPKPTIAPIWIKIFPKGSSVKRPIMSFVGGVLFMLGASLATGCTSGNGISGIALLYIGSFIVITCMFIGGVLIAHFFPRIRS